jgi:lipoprotein-anchoring transpeptidase ErfK/SrfK
MTAARKTPALLLLIAFTSLTAGAVAAESNPKPRIHATQDTVRLLTIHQARAEPGGPLTRARTIPPWRPVTGGPTVLPVTGRKTLDGVQWLRVEVPGRPNGSSGWITKQQTIASRTAWHIVVRTASRQLRVYHHGRLDRTFSAVVGKPSTPTPRGTFFVEESVRMIPGSAGAPFALATSARSNVLQEFEGGPGQIAIHGVQGLAGKPGTASSHGCVRLTDTAITWLANHIGAGVPVTIV